ncbi:MAG TPA: peptidyl-prolyl cis-trans isomerase, partial [Gaiellaceae bacterium]|nr:peptidyl-prolyl cis-trans isomerase [Gaiellaceae bacterium]
MTKRLFIFLPVGLIAAALVAGCGGGTRGVPTNAVAVVGKDTITKTDFSFWLGTAQSAYKARKQAFPQPGTTQYKSIQDQVITYLVEQDELKQKASDLGVSVQPKDVTARLAQIKVQYFGGSEKKYKAQLAAQGATEKQVELQIFAQLLSEKIYNKVTASVKVSDGEVSTYYNAHKSTYSQAATRDVRHILVNNKALADKLETQLKGGASFATLAKKYSKDPGSASQGGKLTISKGQTVPQFDKVAFALATGKTSPPVHTQYGWHIIEALSAVKPAKTTPLASVKESIRQQLLQSKKTTTMTDWVANLKKDFAK